jgi:hypothetical protein
MLRSDRRASILPARALHSRMKTLTITTVKTNTRRVVTAMEDKTATIKVPEIEIQRQQFWEDLEGRYRSRVVIRNGAFNFTETFFYMAHGQNRSSLLHSLVAHLVANREFYTKRYSYELWLIKGAVLEGFFGLRECLAGLVNAVFEIGVDRSRIRSTHKIMQEARNEGLGVSDYLEQITRKGSVLDSYLSEFRHPYIHREDLSNFSAQDMIRSLFGLEQQRITKFIDRSLETSLSLEEIEKAIVKECAKRLGLDENNSESVGAQ